jgi:hypothetical protein
MGQRTSASLSLRKKPSVSLYSALAQVVEGLSSTTNNNLLNIKRNQKHFNINWLLDVKNTFILRHLPNTIFHFIT